MMVTLLRTSMIPQHCSWSSQSLLPFEFCFLLKG